MKKDKKPRDSVSRRSFLKTSALGLGGAAVVASGATSALAAAATPAKSAEHYPNAFPIHPVAPPTKWDYETDFLVIGGGGAGLTAAVTAKQLGANVMVLEKNPWCGGDSSLTLGAEGNFGARAQKQMGVPDITLEERVQSWLDVPNATAFANPTMVRQVMEAGAETFDWLEDIGVTYCTDIKYAYMIKLLMTGQGKVGLMPIDPEHKEEQWEIWHPMNGGGFTRVLEKKARELKIPILLESPIIALVAEHGTVVGAVASTPEGKKYISAKAVLLSTGGFSANKDMLLKYVPTRKIEDVRSMSYPGATGDGIRMAQGLGAIVDVMDEIERWDGGALWHPNQVGETHAWYYAMPNQLVRQKSLTVNLSGKRFFDESLVRGYHYTYQ